MPAEWELSDDLPDEDVLVIEITPHWKMYFDGASHKEGAGAGVVFVTSEGEVLPYSFTLTQNCSNNVAEYQALIFGLEMDVDTKQQHLKVYGDSQLVINQLLGLYEVKKPELLSYHNYAKRLMGWLGDVELEHLPRRDNKQADALAKLASILSMTDKEAQEDWRQPLVDYLKYGKLPSDPQRRTDIRRRATRFIYYKGTLYRRSFEGIFLRCLSDDEKDQAIEEAHSGVCGAHQSGPKLHFRIKRMGYYWPTMVKDCIDYAKRCQACQFHANLIHQPPEPLHPTVASWPFDAWGLDVMGPMTKSSGGHLYILAATDYFSKWPEAVPLKEVKKENVADFIRTNIIYHYGVPRQRNSSMYYAAANGLAEAFNKTLCSLLKKVVVKSKCDWHERIGEALWQIPSLRIAIQEGLTEEENARLRLEELEALDEKRLEAQQRLECYQARLSKAFNKKVRPRSFQVGDLVLAVRRPIITTHRTGNKFLSKWDGPYVVQEAYTNGAYKLVAEDGLRIGPINGKFLKRYYA
ncbi:UNVERIFIED_CONTAM: hypothetical protein Slati_3815700 [Sesamum latifolium]|uniref:RNase H type-1 domain-containing protein n=1 Tax=Sesamum latifolium TaxID=2727402 RepID=A0AAW2U7E9_9LAMI